MSQPPVPAADYDLPPIDWDRVSPAFAEFFHHYFVDPIPLSRGEVRSAGISGLSPDDTALAASLLRRNLRLGYTHIIDGLGLLGDRGAAAQLRALLESERDLSRRLVLARNLWRLDRDAAFPAILSELAASENPTLKQAHMDDVLLLDDERAVDILVEYLDDQDDFVRAMALTHLNSLECRTFFLMSPADLPHSAAEYRARRWEPQFVARLVENLRDSRASWPVVWKQ